MKAAFLLLLGEFWKINTVYIALVFFVFGVWLWARTWEAFVACIHLRNMRQTFDVINGKPVSRFDQLKRQVRIAAYFTLVRGALMDITLNLVYCPFVLREWPIVLTHDRYIIEWFATWRLTRLKRYGNAEQKQKATKLCDTWLVPIDKYHCE